MRRHIGIVAFIAVLVAGCAGLARPEAGTVRGIGAERPVPAPLEPSPGFARALARGTRTADGRPGPNHWMQDASYDLTARLFPEAHRLEGTARIVYRNHAPDTLAELHLELVQNVHRRGARRNTEVEETEGVALQRVAAGGEALREGGEGPHYTVDGTQLVLFPARPVAPGDSVMLDLAWSFTVPRQGAASRMGYADDLFFLAYWFPIFSVYDDVAGWVDDPFLGQAEFYYGYGDYDVTVELPAGWVVWGTGVLQNEEEVLAPDVLARLREARQSDDPVRLVGPGAFGRATVAGESLRWRFRAERVRDFTFVATRGSIWEAARAPVGDRDGDGVADSSMTHTFFRPSAPGWAEVTRFQQHALAFLSAHTGLAYPYPHVTSVEGTGIVGGGMEYPMMVLNEDFDDPDVLYYFIAHEVGHMWIPMVVGTDERRASWFDEGVTSYNENQAQHAADPGPDHDLEDQEQYLAAARMRREGPILRSSDEQAPPAYFIASYPKPSAVLTALRSVLGEAVFDRAFQTFFREWAFKHPYPDDFFNTFERVSGRDLDWFWRSWYYETWTLDQAVAAVEAQQGGVRVTVEDHGLVPMPVDLVLTLAGGDTLRHEIPVDAWLRGARTATVTVPAAAPVTRVAIDPERDFPDVDRSNNVWER